MKSTVFIEKEVVSHQQSMHCHELKGFRKYENMKMGFMKIGFRGPAELRRDCAAAVGEWMVRIMLFFIGMSWIV